MSGVIGKFFLQFGVTLCVCVLLSYLEAITLAPARCSQMLDASREARSRIGRAVDRGFKRLERRLRAGAARRARPAPGRRSPSALALFVARDPGLPGPAQGDGAVAGPVAPDAAPADGGRLRPLRDRPADAARRGLPAREPEVDAGVRRRRRLRRRRRQLGHPVRHLRAARRAREAAGRVHGDHPQGAQLLPRPARGRAGPRRSRASPPSAASRSSSRCAAPTGSS